MTIQLKFAYTDSDYEEYDEALEFAPATEQAGLDREILTHLVTKLNALRSEHREFTPGHPWRGCSLRSFNFTISNQGDPVSAHKYFKQLAINNTTESLLVNYIDLTGNNFYQGLPQFGYRLWADEEHLAGQQVAMQLAMHDKRHVIKYALHLTDSDMDHEVYQAEEINQLVQHWGCCREILFLLAMRLTAAIGQHGIEQFDTVMKNHGLRESVCSEANLNELARFVALGICYQYNHFLSYPSDSKADFFSELLFRHALYLVEWTATTDDARYAAVTRLLGDQFGQLVANHSQRALKYYLQQVTRLGFHRNIAYD